MISELVVPVLRCVSASCEMLALCELVPVLAFRKYRYAETNIIATNKVVDTIPSKPNINFILVFLEKF